MAMTVGTNNKISSATQEIERRTTDSRVLYVSGEGGNPASIEKDLQDLGRTFELRTVSSFESFQETLKEYSPDVILVELNLPDFDGIKALEYLSVNKLNVPVIVVPGQDAGEAGDQSKRRRKTIPELITQALQVKVERPAGRGLKSIPGLEGLLLEMEDSEGTGIAIAEADSGRILYANEAFGGITGFSPEELLSMKTILKIVLSDDIALYQKSIRKAAENKIRSSNFQLRIVKKNGLIAQLRIAARQFDENHKTRIAMIAHDTAETTERLTGAGIRSQNGAATKFWAVAENTTSFAVFDIDESGRVRSWNYGAEQFTGYSGVEMTGKEIRVFLSDEEAENKLASFLDGSPSPGKIELESWVTHKSGQRFRAAMTVTKLADATGVPSGYSAFVRHLHEEGVSRERLREREAQLHSLAAYLQQTREEEKTFIARQLHDEFGQMLAALRMDLSILGKMISRTVSEPLGRGSLLEKISSSSEILERAIRSARDMITELRPAVLDELGLLTAVQWQVMEFENRTGIECHITQLQHGETFDPAVSTTTFRILQEALDNVQQHSAATEASISLQVVGTNIVLEVSDNGKGIEEHKLKAPSSIGIIGMRERVLALGGKLDVRGEPGKGTTLAVSIPLSSNHSLTRSA